ncbi:unnamed protein product [Schistosoma curassoni]|uniref:Uncharacterized protein n=1 Tax=Schistosoma curassoni TaxID=6186 RepID=A0A183KYS5_9TREM|nr:unnamed protein product [Schistosoma curassoni]
MDDNWEGVKESLTSTCQGLLGRNTHHHKEWISTEILEKNQERENKKTAINDSRIRAEKVNTQAENTGANKQVKRSIRAEKQNPVEHQATTSENASREGNIKQPYDITRKLTGKYSKADRSLKDKEGKPNTEFQEQRNR